MRVDQVKGEVTPQLLRNMMRRPIVGSRLKRVQGVSGTYQHSGVEYVDLIGEAAMRNAPQALVVLGHTRDRRTIRYRRDDLWFTKSGRISHQVLDPESQHIKHIVWIILRENQNFGAIRNAGCRREQHYSTAGLRC